MKAKVFCYLLVFSVVLVFSGLQAVAGEKDEMLKPHSEVQQLKEDKGKAEAIQKMKGVEPVEKGVEAIEEVEQLKGKGEKGVEAIQKMKQLKEDKGKAEAIQSEPTQIAPTPEIRQKGETSIIDVPSEK